MMCCNAARRELARMTDLTVTVYSPESPLRHPVTFLRSMLKDLLLSRELAWRLFVRDFSAQYRQSLLGYAWVFIPPLAASLPFVFLNSQGIVKVGATPIPYPAFAMVGTIIWQVFVDALNSPLKAITVSRVMLTRINFPKEAILLAGLADVGLSLLIRLLLLALVFIAFRIVPPATVILFPLGLIGLAVFGLMLGVLITPLGLLYKDVQQSLPVATTFLMLLTPVVYPTPKNGIAVALANLNPLTPLVNTARDWLTVGVAPQAGTFFVTLAVTIVLFVAFWTAYRITLPHLIARMGN
jgi:lipopolysaccharide transport system permease protein